MFKTYCTFLSQVIVLGLSDERSERLVEMSVVDLLQDREGFTWKGHDRLEPRLKPAPFPPGFQPLVLVQCLPPASVTAVALHAEWNLIAFGTSHGFGLFDYHRRNAVLARWEKSFLSGGSTFRHKSKLLNNACVFLTGVPCTLMTPWQWRAPCPESSP